MIFYALMTLFSILLVSDDEQNPVVKVTDFGLSKFVDIGSQLKTFCGTPNYLAPEVLISRFRGDGSYTAKVDMWSLGVILYILLSGHPPFNPERSDKPMAKQIAEGDYSFPAAQWRNISQSAVDLVKKLMCVDAESRLSAEETLGHPWLQDADVVQEAERLMATQRGSKASLTPATSALDNILPEEWNTSGSTVTEPVASTSASCEGSNGAAGEAKNATAAEDGTKFKRPLTDSPSGNNNACKRARVAAD